MMISRFGPQWGNHALAFGIKGAFLAFCAQEQRACSQSQSRDVSNDCPVCCVRSDCSSAQAMADGRS
jgi:hypothetical protein